MSFSRSKFSLALRSSTAAVCTALASRSLLDFESCSRCSASATDEVKPQASEEDQPNSNESTSRKRARGNQLYSCEDLNDLKWRVSYKNRREECNAIDSCVFIGRSITGTCTLREGRPVPENGKQGDSNKLPDVPLVLQGHQADAERTDVIRRQKTMRQMRQKISELETELADDGKHGLTAAQIAGAMDALDFEQSAQDVALTILKEEGMQAFKESLKSQVTAAAAEELRLQQDEFKLQQSTSEAFAKDFLVQVLRNPDLPSKMGPLLKSIFQDSSISTATRHLVYSAIGLEDTYQNALWLSQDQVNWLLTGTDWMDDEVAKLCTYLVKMPYTKVATVPIVSWAVREPGVLDLPAARGLSSSLPYASQHLEESMIWATTQALQADWALDLAKVTLREVMLPSNLEADSSSEAKSAPESVSESDANHGTVSDEGAVEAESVAECEDSAISAGGAEDADDADDDTDSEAVDPSAHADY